jgi:hypothetical protein
MEHGTCMHMAAWSRLLGIARVSAVVGPPSGRAPATRHFVTTQTPEFLVYVPASAHYKDTPHPHCLAPSPLHIDRSALLSSEKPCSISDPLSPLVSTLPWSHTLCSIKSGSRVPPTQDETRSQPPLLTDCISSSLCTAATVAHSLRLCPLCPLRTRPLPTELC